MCSHSRAARQTLMAQTFREKARPTLLSRGLIEATSIDNYLVGDDTGKECYCHWKLRMVDWANHASGLFLIRPGVVIRGGGEPLSNLETIMHGSFLDLPPRAVRTTADKAGGGPHFFLPLWPLALERPARCRTRASHARKQLPGVAYSGVTGRRAPPLTMGSRHDTVFFGLLRLPQWSEANSRGNAIHTEVTTCPPSECLRECGRLRRRTRRNIIPFFFFGCFARPPSPRQPLANLCLWDLLSPDRRRTGGDGGPPKPS